MTSYLEGFFGSYRWRNPAAPEPLARWLDHRIVKGINFIGFRCHRLVIVECLGRTSTGRVWGCACDCGLMVAVRHSEIQKYRTKSCGCIDVERKRRLTPGQSSLNTLYAQYKRCAVKRGLTFELSLQQFQLITKERCYYCDIEPMQVASRGRALGVYMYNGIDRIDNNSGYLAGNVVSCCGVCNHAKATMSFLDFKAWVNRLTLANSEGKGAWKTESL